MRICFALWLAALLFAVPLTVQAYTQEGIGKPEQPTQNREIDNSGSFQVAPEDRYFFPGISGPVEPTVIRAVGQSWARYSQGGQSRMAVLVTDLKSDWLGIAHGLKSIGIPFVLTRDYRMALQHRVVMVYPSLSAAALPSEAVAALGGHARNGGALLAVQPLAAALNSLFGYTEAIPGRQHRGVQFQPGSQAFALDDPREATIALRGERSQDTFGCYSFLFPQGKVVANYEDGSAAIVKRQYGGGVAYAIGIDIGHWLLNGYNNRAESSARSYVNDYEPTLDVLLHWLKMVYQQAEGDAVTLGTVPQGKDMSMLLTHDLDFGLSTVNAVTYAEFEKSMGIRGTYFVQTKYIRDFYDDIFFNETYLSYVKKLLDLGMEIGSHTVSHSRVLAYLPLGTGSETYPTYQPSINGYYAIHNGTVMGELRISKFLLEKTTGVAIKSFRAGHLQNPIMLPQALESSGYLYNSNVTANSSLTHLPFQLTYGRDNGDEVNVYEIPLTIEDEADPPMEARLDKAIALGKKLSRYGGTMNILIHPNIVGGKFVFEQGMVAAFRDSAWFGSVSDYGRWWAARDRLDLDVTAQGNLRIVHLIAPQSIDGLPLTVPAGWKLQSTNARQLDRKVLVDCAAGETLLTFQLQ